AAARDLESSGAVASAEPDYIAVPLAVPNDPRFGEQWNYGPSSAYGIGLPNAWSITKGSPSIVVAVLDTGIRPHVDFGTRIITDGDYDMISDSTLSNDGDGRDGDATDMGDYCADDPGSTSSWHGTHVAGTIAAATNNGVGVAGVDWNAKVLPVRVLGCDGGDFSQIADGIRYAAGLPVTGVPPNPHPADVINMSIGGYTGGGCTVIMQDAIDAATARGAIVVVAAGNDGDSAGLYSPASCNNVISVGATNRTGRAAFYSNYGSKLDVSAPGGDGAGGVLSTLNDGITTPGADIYGSYMGTSMASPHVAGVVSLLLSLKPNLNIAGVESILTSTAHAFAAGSDCPVLGCGAGIVDAGAALKQLRSKLLTVTAANGRQHWKVGTSRRITWASTTPASNIKIELLRKGQPTVALKNVVSSSKHYWTWNIPTTTRVSTKALIKLTRTLPSGIVISDQSNAYFYIQS
ncbi:MAG: serine protease, partial [Actinomycetota bacterium]|nr:serine protease [Actinomycetota bacterium]